MIEELDDVLRRLLIREMPIKNNEVDIKFDQPGREWSARLSRPTLNLFLYDVRENQKLRQTQPMWEMVRNDDGTATQRRKPVRTDLHYMITAWANEPEDEHRLLSRTLMALFRFPKLPEELLPECFLLQPKPIPITVAQYDELRNPTELWQVLDNEMRPTIACIVTLALDPYQPVSAPLVRTRELRFGQAAVPSQQRLDDPTSPDNFWTIGGTICGDEPLDVQHMRLTLVERGLEVQVQPEGRFAIGRLEAGEYTLEVTVDGGKPKRYKISVPSPDYEFKV
jgi:hypothetical protein